MLARPYDPKDARGCDLLLARNRGITDPTRDEIFVTGPPGNPTGMLVYREAAYIHEFECGPRTGSASIRLRADALANYAVAAARTKGIRSAVFLVKRENEAMKRWAEALGAVDQTLAGDALYLLTPP
jgi:hypothetical protein